MSLNQQVPSSSLGRLTKIQLQNPASKQPSKGILLTKFFNSRRQGISPQTIRFYRTCLTPFLRGYPLTSQGINEFLTNLKCGNAKHAYFRTIRAFCNWVTRDGYLKDNPIARIDAPKPSRQILPSLTMEQVDSLIEQADNVRDEVIISLLADSGMRLSELANIKAGDIDWESHTITIWGKGNKQRKAPFTERTTRLLRELISQNGTGENIWHMKPWGIVSMLARLEKETGLKCNPHTFRRTFASNLHRAGMDIEHIMRLGGRSSLDMVLMYTRSVKFEDSLKHYQRLNSMGT